MGTYTVAKVSFKIQETDPTQGGCSTLRCGLSEVLLDPAVVTAAFFIALGCFAAFAYVNEARSYCREERRRVADERDAFEEFAERVAGLSPTDATGGEAASGGDPSTDGDPANAGPVVGMRTGRSVDSGWDPDLERVVDAYRETVTAVPHYEEEYDDTVAESLAEELGYDTAVATVSGKTLSPGLQSALVTRSQQARANRAELLDAIDEELDALDDAETTLSAIDRERRNLRDHLAGVSQEVPFDAAVDIWNRLSALEERCDDAVKSRQDELRDPPMETGDGPPLYEYLYSSLPETDYPVLAQFTQLAEQLQTDRRRIERRFVAPE
ncbi:MAG: hypothetical protein ABEH81_15555 [Halopenitus sp.]